MTYMRLGSFLPGVVVKNGLAIHLLDPPRPLLKRESLEAESRRAKRLPALSPNPLGEELGLAPKDAKPPKEANLLPEEVPREGKVDKANNHLVSQAGNAGEGPPELGWGKAASKKVGKTTFAQRP